MNSIEEMKKKLGVFADNPLSRNDVNFLLAALAEKDTKIATLTHRLELATNMYLSHKDKNMVELKREIAEKDKNHY